MKKIIISALLVFGFGGWVISQQPDGEHRPIVAKPNPVPASSNTIVNQVSTTPPVDTNPAPAASAPAASAPPPAPVPKKTVSSGRYRDGSYTGSVVDAYYGLVQVKAIISGGRIADVQFLQYPSDRSQSRQINSEATPLLTQEAISAQSANVGGVSGASLTSAAFIRSLQAALSQA